MLVCKYWQVTELSQLPVVAAQIAGFLQHAPVVWRLDGPMGAGKTTLASAFGKYFMVQDVVQSPTFGIVNEYETQKGQAIYHFDFYRLKNEEEALAIGVEEYLDSGNLCWLEWAERIIGLLPEDLVNITISVETDNTRFISVSYYE